MTILKFQLFYNGQESYDNLLIEFDEKTDEFTVKKTTYDTGVFGNFWPHRKTKNNQKNLDLKVTLHNKEFIFTSSEVAFQAAKCKNIDDINKFTKNNFHSLDAFRLGRKVDLIDNWDAIKVNVMIDILQCKFTQYDELKTILLNTDDAYLIEHTPVKKRDKFWADDCDGTGQNNLGMCLMTVRQKLGGKKPNKKCVKLLPRLYEFIKKLKNKTY